MSGKLIVFYGINNLGKTTQAKLLVERLIKEGYQAKYLKYAVYGLEPSGPLLNDYLRKNNPLKLTPREFQILQVLNRYQYQSLLLQELRKGVHIVAEDYVGTGLAWGIGAGVDEKFLKSLNKDLHREDLSFLFTGQRFREAVEDGHAHEANEKLTEQVRLVHERLGREFGWININSNETKEVVHEKIWQIVAKKLASWMKMTANQKS